MSGLGKLIKHELRSIGRVMLPLYGALILVSILFGISLMTSAMNSGTAAATGGTGSVLFETLAGIVYGLLIGAVFAVTAVLLIQRFYRNLLGNEGYLCFTLPVSTNTHIANKTISAGIWIVLGTLVGILSALILATFFVTPAEWTVEVGRVIAELTGFSGTGSSVLLVMEIIILALMYAGKAAIKIYAAISLGQLWSNHRVIGAIAAYIGFGICEGIIGNIVGLIMPSSVLNIYGEIRFSVLQVMLLIMFIALALTGAAYWFVTCRILDRRLNLQ